MELWIRFECGRRDVNDPECRYCGSHIHQRPGEDTWRDGRGETTDDGFGRRWEFHEHVPALVEGPTIGPFAENYIQITYDGLRHEGELVAYLGSEGDWIICDPWTGAGEHYSDIVIYTKES